MEMRSNCVCGGVEVVGFLAIVAFIVRVWKGRNRCSQ